MKTKTKQEKPQGLKMSNHLINDEARSSVSPSTLFTISYETTSNEQSVYSYIDYNTHVHWAKIILSKDFEMLMYLHRNYVSKF